MTDTVQITRDMGGSHLDEATGQTIADPPEVVYAGPGRLQVASGRLPGLYLGGGEGFVVQYMGLQIPTTAPTPLPNDTVTVTASQTDPNMVGLKYVIGALGRKTHATMQRIMLREVT
jgi:hypothetical protein